MPLNYFLLITQFLSVVAFECGNERQKACSISMVLRSLIVKRSKNTSYRILAWRHACMIRASEMSLLPRVSSIGREHLRPPGQVRFLCELGAKDLRSDRSIPRRSIRKDHLLCPRGCRPTIGLTG